MKFTSNELKVKSSDGKHMLHGIILVPEGEIKGLVQIVHGMTEHIERYRSFMEELCKEGYVVFGHDHLGHGKTAIDESELGFFAHKDGYKLLYNDVFLVYKHVSKLYPGKKHILFGHSMGSFVVRLATKAYPDMNDGLIICGTGGPNPAAPIGLLLADIIRLFKGEKHKSRLLEKLAFGSYNNRFEGNIGNEWLTKTESILKTYINDPLCTFKFTVSAMHDLIKLNRLSNINSWYKSIPENLPILLISGSEDPVGNYGKGVKTVYSKLKKSGRKDVTIKIYENCRHEILNDTCRKETIDDVKTFIKRI